MFIYCIIYIYTIIYRYLCAYFVYCILYRIIIGCRTICIIWLPFFSERERETWSTVCFLVYFCFFYNVSAFCSVWVQTDAQQGHVLSDCMGNFSGNFSPHEMIEPPRPLKIQTCCNNLNFDLVVRFWTISPEIPWFCNIALKHPKLRSILMHFGSQFMGFMQMALQLHFLIEVFAPLKKFLF